MSDYPTPEVLARSMEVAKQERKRILDELKQNSRSIVFIVKARMCEHDWHSIDGFMYASYECKKCG